MTHACLICNAPNATTSVHGLCAPCATWIQNSKALLKRLFALPLN